MPLSTTTETPADGSVTRAKLASGFVQTVRQATGSIGAAGVSSVVCNFAQAFANTNYTVQAVVQDAASDLRVRCVTARATGSVTVQVENTDAVNTASGTIHVVAWAD